MPRVLFAKLIRGGDDWRQATFLLLTGVAAWLFAQVQPGFFQFHWFYTTPLIWVSGLLLLTAAWYLPNRPVTWWTIKLVLVGAVIHWAIVLPVRFWWW